MSEESETPENKENQRPSGGIFTLKNEYLSKFRNWAGYKLLDDDKGQDIDELKEKLDSTYDPEQKDALRQIIDNAHRPTNDDLDTSGVLLRDEILYYQRKYDLIEPFEPDSLKPAGYELRVGDQYSVEGESKTLDRTGSIDIGPFEVAIIKTRERVNLPHFMIGRWNIKVSKAYDGLLWVGGPQVDPGYSGHLFCPIYNLSDSEVSLNFEEELAVIDFVKTTPFKTDGRSAVEQKWEDLDGEWDFSDEFDNEIPQPEKYKDNMKSQNRITFSQYNPDKLESALFSEVEERITKLGNRIDQLERALRLSFAAFITIIAVLFSALSLIAAPESSNSGGGGDIAASISFESAKHLVLSSLPFVGIILLLVILISIYMIVNVRDSKFGF
jgi:deoxycytidine triphosphate deaminase